MVIDNANQIFGVSNIILLSPSSRVHIAKVALAVSLECLLLVVGRPRFLTGASFDIMSMILIMPMRW
jgi:hypothetical protein